MHYLTSKWALLVQNNILTKREEAIPFETASTLILTTKNITMRNY